MPDPNRMVDGLLYPYTPIKPLKFDEGKPNLSLIPPLWNAMLARVLEYGLKKYYKDSWKEFTLQKAKDDLIPAAMRHLDAYRDGEYISEEGLPHLSQTAWNCLVLLWHEEKNRKVQEKGQHLED